MRRNMKDEDFDFGLEEDIQQSPKIISKDTKPKKNKAVIEQDFFDLDDQIQQEEKNKEKLPVIFPKSSTVGKIDQKRIPSQKKSAVKLENLVVKKQMNDQDDYQSNQKVRSNTYKNKNEKNLSKQEIPSKLSQQYDIKQNHSVVKDQENQNYGEDFQADEYNQQFQQFNEQVNKNKSKIQNSKIQKVSQTIKTISRQKQQSLNRSSSRQSVKSHKSAKSQNKVRQSFSYAPEDNSKYYLQVNRQFPEIINLNQLTIDNLTKMNERIRSMIRKLNEQLNQILTRNTLLMKAKKEDKTKGVQDKLKLLFQDKKNNEKMLQRMIMELKKLKYRQGQIRQQDYQLQMHKKIEQNIQKKKDLEKIIHRMKLQISNEGKKLYQVVQKKQNQSNQSAKIDLIHLRKEEEKNLEMIQNLQNKIKNSQEKTQQIQGKFKKLVQEAIEKGIDLEPKGKLFEKYQQLKKKQISERKNINSVETLIKNKKERLYQQNMLIKRKIQNYQSQIKNIYNDIDHMIKQSVQVIQKSKENPKIMKSIQHSLQQISKSLVNQPIEQYIQPNIQKSYKSTTTQKKQQTTKKKNQVEDQDFLPLNPNQKKIGKFQQNQEQSVKAKPNFLKKKQQQKNINQKQGSKAYQRLWKEETQIQQKSIHQQKAIQKKPQQIPKNVQQIKTINDISKPAFMLKKKNNNQNLVNNQMAKNNISVTQSEKQQAIQPKKQIINQNIEQKKENLMINLGPKFLRLKKKDENQNKPIIKQQIETKIKIQQDIPVLKKQQPISEEKPLLPKRFGLRKKQPKQQQGYNPTAKIDVKQQQKPKIILEQKVNNDLKIKQQKNKNPYSLGVLENNINKQQKSLFKNPYGPKQNNNLSSNIQQNPVKKQEKTVFKNPYAQNNQAQNNQINQVKNPYITQNQVKQQKPVINNPYAQNQNQYIPQRQGKLKKPKMQGLKQKINIYQAAEEPVINEIQQNKKEVNNPILKQTNNTHKHQQMDINQLLGLKPKNNDPQDDILFGGNKKVQKKFGNKKLQNDFFGGLDV